MTRVVHFVRYLWIFAKALTLANYQVTKLALTPKLAIRPGFVAMPLAARSDFEITAFANSITLTPGTITVHVDPDEHVIVIHAIDVGDDPQAVRDDCKNTLEANILRFTRPARRPAEVA